MLSAWWRWGRVFGAALAASSLLGASDCGYTLGNNDCPCQVDCDSQYLAACRTSRDLTTSPGPALVMEWFAVDNADYVNRVLIDQVEIRGMTDAAAYGPDARGDLPVGAYVGRGTVAGFPLKGEDIHVRWPIECIDPPDDLPERDIQSTWLFDLSYEDIPANRFPPDSFNVYGVRDPDED